MNAVGSWDRSSCNMRVVEDEPQESALMSSTPYRAFIWHSTPMAYHDCWSRANMEVDIQCLPAAECLMPLLLPNDGRLAISCIS